MIVKCSHCKQIFASKDFDKHECDLSLKELKTILVVDYLDVSCKNKKMMSGWGIDGVLYTFEVVSRKPIPIVSPIRRFFTDKQPDDNLTEPVLGHWYLLG